jgi:hypothetical protein
LVRPGALCFGHLTYQLIHLDTVVNPLTQQVNSKHWLNH